MAPRRDIREQIDAFRSLCDRETPQRVLAAAREALADRHRLMVAKSAELGVYRNNARLRARLDAVIAERDDPRLGAGYAKAFPPATPGP